MKTQVSSEFILQAYAAACTEWKEKIKKECPELFKSKSGWYKTSSEGDEKWLVFYDYENKKRYGFNSNGEWFEDGYYMVKRHTLDYLAEEDEVKKALIKEADKRGFKIGVKYDSLMHDSFICENNTTIDHIYYSEHKNCLYSVRGVIFDNEKWAEIIKETKKMTITEIENTLGYSIEIIN